MSSNCALWARVSTAEQESANQLAGLRAWAARRSLEVTAEYVLDGASAWRGEHRELLRQALDDARAGRFEVLLVWALDRLSREGVEATLGLLRRFRDRGVVVWSLTEPWTETSDPHMAAAVQPVRVDGPDGIGAAQRARAGRAGQAQGRWQAGRPAARRGRPEAAPPVRVRRAVGTRAGGNDGGLR
jgi:Resolvase, N terminal domain